MHDRDFRRRLGMKIIHNMKTPNGEGRARDMLVVAGEGPWVEPKGVGISDPRGIVPVDDAERPAPWNGAQGKDVSKALYGVGLTKPVGDIGANNDRHGLERLYEGGGEALQEFGEGLMCLRDCDDAWVADWRYRYGLPV